MADREVAKADIACDYYAYPDGEPANCSERSLRNLQYRRAERIACPCTEAVHDYIVDFREPSEEELDDFDDKAKQQPHPQRVVPSPTVLCGGFSAICAVAVDCKREQESERQKQYEVQHHRLQNAVDDWNQVVSESRQPEGFKRQTHHARHAEKRTRVDAEQPFGDIF